MSLSRVIVNPDALHACLSHALSTEHQEIMGLLLGSLINDATEAYIQRSMVLSRKDKKKDRVEVSYADLGLASTVAEDLSLTIVGWYHSHPHITVLPSHVDVKTQGQYQVLGKFLGLIFSVFDKGQLEMCAFQSKQNRNGEWERVEIPVIVGTKSFSSGVALQTEKRLLESLIAMQMVLMNEDKETLEANFSRNNQTWSHLKVMRLLSVFQSGIYRLIDLQIFPLLMGMKSKISTLNYERDRILRSLGSSEDRNMPVLKCDDNKSLKTMLSATYSNLDSSSVRTNFPSIPVSSVDESKEISDRSLRALTKTIPKYTRSVRALRLILSGITGEIVASSSQSEIEDKTKNIGTEIRRGNQYTIKVKHANVTGPMWGEQNICGVLSPWLLDFESNETETEDDSKKHSSQFPLIAVSPSLKPSNVDFTVLCSHPFRGTSICSSSGRAINPSRDNEELTDIAKCASEASNISSSSSSSLSSAYKEVTITVHIKDTQYSPQACIQTLTQVEVGDSGQNVDRITDTMLMREDLHTSLRLHLWPPQ